MMKLRLLLILVSGVLILYSCSVFKNGDLAQHKHLRKVPVESPDAEIKKADIKIASAEEFINKNITLKEDEVALKTEASENEEEIIATNHSSIVSSVKSPVKFLNIIPKTTRTMAGATPIERPAVDPITILIWALIAVLILALLAIIIPNILDLIIALLFIVLIVVLILYLANSL